MPGFIDQMILTTSAVNAVSKQVGFLIDGLVPSLIFDSEYVEDIPTAQLLTYGILRGAMTAFKSMHREELLPRGLANTRNRFINNALVGIKSMRFGQKRILGLCFARHNAEAEALMVALYQLYVLEKRNIYCGGDLIAVTLHPFGKGFTVDRIAIIQNNNNIAKNSKKYTIMSGIRLHLSILSEPDIIRVIALSVEGCMGAIPIVKLGRNALQLTLTQKANVHSTLNREQV